MHVSPEWWSAAWYWGGTAASKTELGDHNSKWLIRDDGWSVSLFILDIFTGGGHWKHSKLKVWALRLQEHLIASDNLADIFFDRTQNSTVVWSANILRFFKKKRKLWLSPFHYIFPLELFSLLQMTFDVFNEGGARFSHLLETCRGVKQVPRACQLSIFDKVFH